MAKREDGVLTVVTGSSRSGKSAWTKQQIARLEKKLGRILVFDIKGEYSADQGYTQYSNLDVLRQVLKATPGRAKIAYCPVSAKKEFGLWAKMALTWCKMAPCVIVAEETAAVTSPNKAPDGWHNVCSQALGFSAHIFAITQRPSESDKTAIGNASVIHCCLMVRAADRAYMARELDVPVAVVNELKADQETGEFTYIEKDMRKKTVEVGRLIFD